MEVLGTGLNGESYRREVCRAKSKLIVDHMFNFGLSQNVKIFVYYYVGETIEINFFSVSASLVRLPMSELQNPIYPRPIALVWDEFSIVYHS